MGLYRHARRSVETRHSGVGSAGATADFRRPNLDLPRQCEPVTMRSKPDPKLPRHSHMNPTPRYPAPALCCLLVLVAIFLTACGTNSSTNPVDPTSWFKPGDKTESKQSPAPTDIAAAPLPSSAESPMSDQLHAAGWDNSRGQPTQTTVLTNLTTAALKSSVTDFRKDVQASRDLKKQVDDQLREAAAILHASSSIQQGVLAGLHRYLEHVREVERVEAKNEARFAELWLRFQKAIAQQSAIDGLLTIVTTATAGSGLSPQAICREIDACNQTIVNLERQAGTCHEVTSRTIAALQLVEKNYASANAMTEEARVALKQKLDALQAKLAATATVAAGLTAALVAKEVELQQKQNGVKPWDLPRLLLELKTVLGLAKVVQENAEDLSDMTRYAKSANQLFEHIYAQGPKLRETNAQITTALNGLRQTIERTMRQRGATDEEIRQLAARAERADKRGVIFSPAL